MNEYVEYGVVLVYRVYNCSMSPYDDGYNKIATMSSVDTLG